MARPSMPSGESGQTFAEVMVAILLTAIITTSVMSVSVTAKRSGIRSDQKIAASMATRRLQQYLRNYVAMNDPTIPAARNGAGAGPWAGAGPGGTWALPGDGGYTWALASTGGVIGQTCDPTTPLAAPFHNANFFVPPRFSAAPFTMTLRYRVQDTNWADNDRRYAPQVLICVHWTGVQ